jgi:hypothetical protein
VELSGGFGGGLPSCHLSQNPRGHNTAIEYVLKSDRREAEEMALAELGDAVPSKLVTL